MTDREKIIKAIEICYTKGHKCTECPLFSEDDCNDKLMYDALTLLKAREPVAPKILDTAIPVSKTAVRFVNTYWCGACGEAINQSDFYCRKCGQAVKWG